MVQVSYSIYTKSRKHKPSIQEPTPVYRSSTSTARAIDAATVFNRTRDPDVLVEGSTEAEWTYHFCQRCYACKFIKQLLVL